MTPDRETQIRARAYEIWESEGRPDGKEGEHWERAAREIAAGETGDSGSEWVGNARSSDMEAAGPMDGPPQAGNGSGLSSGLQPGGTIPGASPAAGMGSIGTGGAGTKRRSTGSVKRAKK